MKFKLQENEVKRILEMHSEYKKGLLKENPADDAKFQLEAMVKKGCIVNGTLQEINTSLTPEKWSIKLVSTMNPSKAKYYLNTGDVLLWDGTKLSKLPQKWRVEECRNKEMKQVMTAADQQKIESEGWMTADEAQKAGLWFKQGQYEETTIGGIRMYKKAGQEISGQASAEQEQLAVYLTETYGKRFNIRDNKITKLAEINKYCWAFKQQQPVASSPKWILQTVDAGGAYSTPTIEIWRNPTCISGLRTTASERGTEERMAIKVTEDSCATDIRNYYEDWKQGVASNTDDFRTRKNTVLRCKVAFCSKDKVKSGGECDGKWRQGIFGGGNRLNAIIDFFSHKPNSIGQLDRSDDYSLLA